MERTRRISALIQRLETPPFREFIWGHVSCSKQTVVVPHIIAHAPAMRIYGSLDGINWIFLSSVNPSVGVPIEVPHAGLFKTIKIVVVHGSCTFIVASYWV